MLAAATRDHKIPIDAGEVDLTGLVSSNLLDARDAALAKKSARRLHSWIVDDVWQDSESSFQPDSARFIMEDADLSLLLEEPMLTLSQIAELPQLRLLGSQHGKVSSSEGENA